MLVMELCTLSREMLTLVFAAPWVLVWRANVVKQAEGWKVIRLVAGHARAWPVAGRVASETSGLARKSVSRVVMMRS